jgi:D-glycero-D-manno-heptose 1,7-bisphosphate phosphatase
MSQPAIFLDRDGTLIEDADYLSSPEQIRILPRAIAGLQRFRAAGYFVVVVTNQSGVARGLVSEEQLRQIHDRLIEQVELLGGRLDAILYCPHLPEGTVSKYAVACPCRKPKPGLFLRARDELGVDLGQSFAIGDAWRDVEAALAAGIPSVKLARPRGREEGPRPDLPILGEARDLDEAADIILGTTAEEARQRIAAARPRGLFDNGPGASGVAKLAERSETTMGTVTRESAGAVGGGVRQGSSGPDHATPTQFAEGGGVSHGPSAPDHAARTPATSSESVETVLTDVRRLLRRQDDDSFGLPRVFGYLAQLAALCLGVGGTLSAILSSNAAAVMTLFLAAIFAQLVALTMFLLSRKNG